jgi:hypothetical protein
MLLRLSTVLTILQINLGRNYNISYYNKIGEAISYVIRLLKFGLSHS